MIIEADSFPVMFKREALSHWPPLTETCKMFAEAGKEMIIGEISAKNDKIEVHRKNGA